METGGVRHAAQEECFRRQWDFDGLALLQGCDEFLGYPDVSKLFSKELDLHSRLTFGKASVPHSKQVKSPVARLLPDLMALQGLRS